MKLSIWTATLSKNSSPAWPCPACRKGTLALIPDSLIRKETIQSKLNRQAGGWEGDTDFLFTAWLKCRTPVCGQEVAVSGTGGVDPWEGLGPDGEIERDYREYFQPRSLSPMPDMFVLPEKCPTKVKEHLRASFRLFFSDRSASANRIRIALEYLLDHLNIPRQQLAKSGNTANISLHDRIELFTKVQAVLGGQLMALKLLGNTASHEGDVSQEDLLAAFEILEHILIELIEQPSRRFEALAVKLATKHKR